MYMEKEQKKNETKEKKPLTEQQRQRTYIIMYMEKEQKKNETKEKKPLTEQQRQQRKKMLVYPLMGLLFLGSLWLIFAPSSEDREKARQGQGFNTDMPPGSGIQHGHASARRLENHRRQSEGL